MKIELTVTQINAILSLVKKEFEETNKAFYLGLDHTITNQFEQELKTEKLTSAELSNKRIIKDYTDNL